MVYLRNLARILGLAPRAYSRGKTRCQRWDARGFSTVAASMRRAEDPRKHPGYSGPRMFPGPLLGDLDATSLWTAIETAAELSQLGLYIARIDCVPPRILYVTPRAAAMCGRPAEDMVGQLPWSILRESDQIQIQAAIARAPGVAPPLHFDVAIQQPSGKTIPVEIASVRMVARIGTLTFGFLRDVTVEREAVAALRASEARFRFLVEAAPDGVAILVRGMIAFMNPRGAVLLGAGTPEDAIGKPVSSFMPPEDSRRTAERIAEMFRTGKEMPPSEYRTLADPDRVIEIKSTQCTWEGQPAVIAFARDVTERKALQQRMMDADRLSAMGTLAAGVAHEINNPLTYALLGVQRIESLLSDPALPAATVATIRERLFEIEHGITRVASITQGLRSFARAEDAPPGPVDLAAVVERALKMVDNDLRHRAQLVKQLAEVAPVIGNASRLEQVVVNVLLNAIHALPPDGDHTIEITIVPRDDDRVALA